MYTPQHDHRPSLTHNARGNEIRSLPTQTVDPTTRTKPNQSTRTSKASSQARFQKKKKEKTLVFSVGHPMSAHSVYPSIAIHSHPYPSISIPIPRQPKK
ncbi:hypothetical protein BofuT4_uP021020.1 [Botrytis cinerea T4]|uniref:Uncharacterized protein n=1 Tax=Botryotinia fuckeliana (strain T4) TaxID=999810 RepID=G2YJA9_BOTF4|nr:hypothetical protein BofuT4_uP021020.1 [Botrytis cinerea T4]